MAEKRSIFFENWRDCLHAHYLHVLRTHDTVTEPTLRRVLLQTGLSEDELDAIRAEALGTDELSFAEDAPPAAEETPEILTFPDEPIRAEPNAAVQAGIDIPPVVVEELPPPEDESAAVVEPDAAAEDDGYRDVWDEPVAGLSQLSLF